ncbi:MAG TPA: YfhO family protein, partial [Verrucomicrobiae bacterium]
WRWRRTQNTHPKTHPYLPWILITVVWLDVLTQGPAQNPSVPPEVFAPNLIRKKLAQVPQPELGGSRAMLSPYAALTLTHFGAQSPQDNLLAKRMGYCANINLLDGVPKVDGFFSLSPHEFDILLGTLYAFTNANWSHLIDFMGVSQATAPGELLKWSPRNTYLPLVTAGQKPVFMSDGDVISNFGHNNFDGAHFVFLPTNAAALVTVTNASEARILSQKFGTQTVNIEAEATLTSPALVVIAQTYYHHWHAQVDGREAPLLRANYAFQAVQIPPGRHTILLYYRDGGFQVGIILMIVALVNVGFILVRKNPGSGT